MEIINQGHTYHLSNFDKPEEKGQTLQFIHKEMNEGNNEFVVVNDGTTNEKVLPVLINRIKYLNHKAACRENSIVITKLEESLMWLNQRTKNRIAQNVEGTILNHKES